MKNGSYVPERGDLIWLEHSPQAGREQAGRRPGLVLSPRAYNDPSGYALICPITSRVRGYPYEVVLPDDSRVAGVILADQVRSLDWRARFARKIGSVPARIVADVGAKVRSLLD